MTNLTNSSTSTNPALGGIVSAIFAKMQLDYGKKFTDQWSGASPGELREHWVSELTGYTPREIKRGLDGMETRDWPPTLPEFKKLCRPPVSELIAYYEALAGLEARGKGEAGTWSHPAIYWAASLLRVDLMSQTHAQVKDRWAALLKSQMERNEWADIPPPRVMLPAPDASVNARANAEKMLRDLGAAGVLKHKPGKDPKAWAKRILDRAQCSDPTLSILQIKFATMALEASDQAQVRRAERDIEQGGDL